MSSIFDAVFENPLNELYLTNQAHRVDQNPLKVNLSIGIYHTEEGKEWVLPVVRKAENLLREENLSYSYNPNLGTGRFCSAASELLLGEHSKVLQDKKAFGVQTLSGTGALRLGAEFLAKVLKCKIFYVPNPTWHNHKQLFMNAGFSEARTYRYWNAEKLCFDFDGMLEDIQSALDGSVIVLHGCAQNPTGCDPTPEQWMKIAEMMEAKKLIPFFDQAYQGLASGDVARDAFAVRHFTEKGFELFCAQSFAKIFGLYGERVGCLTVTLKDPSKIKAVKSQLTSLVLTLYLNPPAHGSRLVEKILLDPSLKEEWLECVQTMAQRIIRARKSLYEHLLALKTPGTWKHLVEHAGMFSYIGLSVDQCRSLKEKYSIYLLGSGRINICGLNDKNIHYVAQSIHAVVTQTTNGVSNGHK